MTLRRAHVTLQLKSVVENAKTAQFAATITEGIEVKFRRNCVQELIELIRQGERARECFRPGIGWGPRFQARRARSNER